jgi:hypothetical protein
MLDFLQNRLDIIVYKEKDTNQQRITEKKKDTISISGKRKIKKNKKNK